jgi:hypothetical protein
MSTIASNYYRVFNEFPYYYIFILSKFGEDLLSSSVIILKAKIKSDKNEQISGFSSFC